MPMAMEYLYFHLPLLLLAIHIISQYFLQKLKNLPPSPFPALPIIGHTYLLKKPYHRALSQISKKYGPIVSLRLGSRPVVLVSSPKLAEECFTKNDVIFADRPNFLHAKHYGYNYTSLPWSSYGQHWRNLRRIATIELLSSHQIQVLSHFRADETLILIRKLFQETKRGTDKVVQVRSELFEFVFNVLTRMITGRRFVGKEAETFKEISTEITRVGPEANVIDVLPFMRWFGVYRDTEKKMMRVQEKRDRFMQDVMEQHRQRAADGGSFVSDKKRSMMDVLLYLQREEPEYYTDQTIRNLLLVMFTAGSETSSVTLEWAFSLLLDNPNVLTKAQAQIDNLVGQDRLINESDLSQLPYLYHIINETLRLQAPVPLLLPHQSSAQCTVGGYNIPRGTTLLVNAWNIHHSSDVWDDPEKFNPDRFQDFDYVNKKECKLLPFGSGRRACPGENLAIRVVALALGSLIQCFEWEKVSGIDMGETAGLTAAKLKPLAAKCNPRPFVGKLILS